MSEVLAGDQFANTLSFFGRFVDDFTRQPLATADVRVLLGGLAEEAIYKPDGFFVFLNIKPSASDYEFQVLSSLYQRRSFKMAQVTAAPVEISFGGEDEIYVVVRTTNTASNQIMFDPIPFLPIIPKGALVLGEANFSATLKNDLGGVDVKSASLDSVSSLAVGTLLRIIRSRSLVAKPGSYWPFPAGTTILAIKIVEDAPGEIPLNGARARLQSVNTQNPVTKTIGSVPIKQISLSISPPQELILGTEEDLNIFMDSRGNGVFYFPGQWPISSLGIEFSHPGYISRVELITLTSGKRSSVIMRLRSN